MSNQSLAQTSSGASGAAGNLLQLSAALAMELASGLSPASEIFARWGHTPEEARAILSNPTFQQMLKEAKGNWDSDSNVEERIRMKARLALEELLEPHFKMAKSVDTPPPSRIEAMKTFERLSGMSAKEKDSGFTPGERFIVNINLGSDIPSVTIDAPVTAEGEV